MATVGETGGGHYDPFKVVRYEPNRIWTASHRVRRKGSMSRKRNGGAMAGMADWTLGMLHTGAKVFTPLMRLHGAVRDSRVASSGGGRRSVGVSCVRTCPVIKWPMLFLIAVFSGVASETVATSGTNVTTGTQTANWTALSWTGGAPNGIGETAGFIFDNNQNINLNTDITLGRLECIGSGQFNLTNNGLNKITFDNTAAGAVASLLMTRTNNLDSVGRRVDTEVLLNSDLVATWARMAGGASRIHGIRGVVSGAGRLSLNYGIVPTNGPDMGTSVNLNPSTAGAYHILQLGMANGAANTYTGGTDLRAGTNVFSILRFLAMKVDALGSGSSAGRLFMYNAALDLGSFNQTVGGLTGGGGGSVIGCTNTTAGTTSITVDFESDKGPFTYSGQLIDSWCGTSPARLLAFVKKGGGTQLLTGANTFSGGTTINGGTLGFASGALGTSGSILFSGSGTLRWLVGNTEDVSSRMQPIGGSVTAALEVADAADTVTLGSGLSGSGSLAKSGPGVLVFSAANSYGGSTTINEGTLRIAGGNDRLPTGTTVSVANVAGATLDLNNFNQSMGSLTGGGNLGGGVSLGSGTLTVSNSTSCAFTGTISGVTGNLVKQGNGTLTLAGTNSYGGLTTVSNGTLQYGTNNVLADGSTVSVAGGALAVAGYADTVAGVQLLSGSITGSGGTLTSTSALDLRSGAVSAKLGGSVGLNKSTSSTVTLSGSNTYDGSTIVSNGTLAIGVGGGIANSARIDVQSGAILDVTAAGITLGTAQTLKGSGTVNGNVTNSGTVSPGASIGTLTINGHLALSPGSTNVFELSATNDLDRLVGITNITYAGTLTITTNTGASLPAGIYDLFDFTGTQSGTFAVTNLPAVNGMEWQAFDYASGSIELKALSGVQPPVVISPAVTAIGTTNATLGGTLSYDGGEPCTYGTSWDTLPTGTNSNLQTCSTPTNASGVFSHVIAAFAAGGHYYAWAWASNSAAKVFTTSSAEFYAEPVQASGLSISGVTTNSLTVSWVADGSSTGTLVVMKLGGAGVDAVPVDGSNYTADAVFGTAGASMGSGCYAVYGGSGTQVVVSGLSLGTTYSVAAYAYAGSGVGLINYQQAGSPTNSARSLFATPAVTTPSVTNLLTTSARLTATVSSDGGGVSGWGMLWGTVPSPTEHGVTNTGTPSAPFGFTNDLSGLTPGQEYYARAWASNLDHMAYSSGDAHFYTEPLAASNLAFAGVTSTGMTVQWAGSGSGAVVLMGQGVAPSAIPVDGSNYAYNASFASAPSLGNGKVVYAGNAGSVAVSGLVRTSTYYVAVYEYAGSMSLINYQQVAPATGSQATPAELPTVTTPTVSGIGTTNALTGATLADNGGAAITSWGTTWSTSATGTNDNSLAGSGPTNGAFTLMRAGLPSATNLYVWGWASNSVGISYTAVSTNFFTEPLAASNVTFSGVTSNSMTVAWMAGNGGRRIVVLKRGGPVTNVPADGVDYAADSVFGNGANLGGNEYIVFNGTGTNVAVSGLTRSVYFHAAVFEYSGDANVPLRNYQQDMPATNSQRMTVLPQTFVYDGTNNASMDWDNPTNYVGDLGFPDGPGDVLIVTSTVQALTYKMNGSRTLGAFLRNYGGGGRNTAIAGGSDASSVLTWDTGVVGSNAAFVVRGGSSTDPDLRCYTAVDLVLNSSLIWDGSSTRNYDGVGNMNAIVRGTVSGAGQLTVRWNASKTDYYPTNTTSSMHCVIEGGSGPNMHLGGTVFEWNGIGIGTPQLPPSGRAGFRLNKQWATGLGNTTVKTNAEIYIPTNNWTGGTIHDSTYVCLEHAGANYAKVDLEGASVTETVARLYFDGVQQAAGTYGNSGSGADYELSNWFAGTGKLSVSQGPLVVTNLAATSIDTNVATLGGEVLGVGQTVSARGTVYGSGSSPTGNAAAEGGLATGVFSHARSGLAAGTHYNYRGWASNATDGLVYSAYDGEFFTEPMPATGIGIDTVTPTSFRVNWTAGVSSSGTVVLVRDGAPVDAVPSDGSNYTANAGFGSGTTVGAGNYTVYAGSGTQVVVTNLTPGHTYHVAAFAYAGIGTPINYQTDEATIPTASKRVPYDAPTLAAPSAAFAAVSTNSAALDAQVLTGGGGPVVAWGTLWATSPVPRTNARTNTGSTNAPFTFSDARTAEFAPGGHYYFCGWASNADAVGYSADAQFYAEPLPVTILAVTSVVTTLEIGWSTNNCAADGVVVLLRQGSPVADEPADGTNYDSVANPNFFMAGTVGDSKVVFSGAGTNVMVDSVPPGQTYYLSVFAYAGADGLRNHQQDSPATASVTISVEGAPPTILSPTATGIGTTNVTLGATVETNNGAAITLWGTAWDTAAPGQANPVAAGTDDIQGAFAVARTGLLPGRHYYSCGWASNNYGISYSPYTEFYTEPVSPTGLSVDSVTSNSFQITWVPDASSSGTVVLVKSGGAVDGAPADGTHYTGDATFGGGDRIGASNFVVAAGTGSSVTVTGLTPGIAYGVAAFAYAGSGTVIQYRLSDAPAVSQRAKWLTPALGAASLTLTDVTTNSATLQAYVSDGGGTNLVRWGTVWAGSPAPTANAYTNSGSTNAPFMISDARAGEFSAGQHYYFRGWADNGDYTGYSSDGEFYTEPNPPANLLFSSVTSTQVSLSWSTNASMTGTLVLMNRGGTVNADPVDGTVYTASNVFTACPQIGTGNYVVYAGSGTNVTVTGIPFAPGQVCNVKVYGFAGSDGLINYQETAPTAATNLPGGSTWTSTTSGNWSDSGNWTNGIVANGAGNTADFSTRDLTSDVTVHLDSARTIGRLVFGDTATNSAAGWTLDNAGTASNVMTLAGGAPTVTVNALGDNKVVAISAVVTGTSGLVKSGTGTLVLSATNTYTGSTTISNGVLRADWGVGIPAAGNLNLAGGVLELSQDLTVAYGTGVNQVQLSASGSGFSAYGTNTVTVSATPAAELNITSAGYVLKLNANSANQDLVFDKKVSSAVRSYIQVDSTNHPVTLTQSLATSGEGLVFGKGGPGTLVVKGGWTSFGARPTVYNGTVIIDGCTLNVTNTETIAVGRDGTSVNQSGTSGVLTVRNGGTVTAKALRLGYDASVSGTVNLDGGVTIVEYVFRQAGTGSATLNFDGGTLRALSATNAADFISNIGNIFVKTGGAILDDGGFSGITITNALRTDVASLGGGLTKKGTGSVILTATNTYTGGTLVEAGTLVANRNGALGTGTNVTVSAGGVLQLNDMGAPDNMIADGASVNLNSGVGGCGKVSLQNGVIETVRFLFLDGKVQPSGTYGSGASIAWRRSDSWFDGSVSGILTVLEGPAAGTIFKFQ